MLVLSLVAGAAAASRQRSASAAALHASYLESKARCAHGEEGLLVSVHPSTSPSAFRRSLEAMVEPHPDTRFHHPHADAEWHHLKVVPMQAAHATMLAALMEHEHTAHVEANCVIRREETLDRSRSPPAPTGVQSPGAKQPSAADKNGGKNRGAAPKPAAGSAPNVPGGLDGLLDSLLGPATAAPKPTKGAPVQWAGQFAGKWMGGADGCPVEIRVESPGERQSKAQILMSAPALPVMEPMCNMMTDVVEVRRAASRPGAEGAEKAEKAEVVEAMHWACADAFEMPRPIPTDMIAMIAI